MPSLWERQRRMKAASSTTIDHPADSATGNCESPLQADAAGAAPCRFGVALRASWLARSAAARARLASLRCASFSGYAPSIEVVVMP